METIDEEPSDEVDQQLLPKEHADDAEATPVDTDDEEPSPPTAFSPSEPLQGQATDPGTQNLSGQPCCWI